MNAMNRRQFAGAALTPVLVPMLGTAPGAAAATGRTDDKVSGEEIGVTVQEGTNLAVTARPGGDRIILHLQGKLFTVARAGGTATPFSDDFLTPFWPSLRPDGELIAVQSFAGGMFHIWTLTPDGRAVRQLTSGEYDDLCPAWSPDGELIAFTSARQGSNDIWTVEARTGALRRVTSTVTPASQPTWSPDGREVAYVRENAIEAVNLATGATRVLVPAAPGFVSAPSWSPDGGRIAFIRARDRVQRLMVSAAPGTEKPAGSYDDAFPFPAAWLSPDELLYGANGKIVVSRLSTDAAAIVPFSATFRLVRDRYPRKRYDFDSRREQQARGIVAPALSPDGGSVVFIALNQLWLQPIGGAPRRLTDDPYYKTDPAWSHDGRRLAYASDKAGTQDIYVLDPETGTERRVTDLPGAQFAPAFSPDDRTLVFQDDRFRTLAVDAAGGPVRTILGPVNTPGRPSWSADGRTLAFTVSAQQRNQIQLVDVASGGTRVIEPAPFGSISARGDDGPVWSPDGRWLAFCLRGTLWVLPVDPRGTPTGPARALTEHASDAPSWSGDSQRLLYLHNGRLRLVALDGSGTREVTTKLAYTPDQPGERLVIHAGRLWDGRAPEPRTDVDLVVEGNRIRSIEPHRGDRSHPGHRFVDASGLTVTPGLIDMHNHQHMRSRSFGDRQGRLLLSFGITTTRSTGDPAYRALEDREALTAGARVGPRFFMTGEMFEGPRLSWEFARQIADSGQLELELSRARELGYDLIKTYQRFPDDWQAAVTAAAHAMGIPTTSHYLYPAIAHGVDMQEHLAGPTRWGFGFSQNASLGIVYDDVIQLLTKGGMAVSSTLFSASALLADDPGIVDDPRVRTLFTAAQQETLLAKLRCAQGTGPCGFLDGNAEAARRDVAVLKRILAAGGTVVAGTDAPLDVTAVSLHLNLRGMTKYGLSAHQALQTATLAAARQLGVDRELGTVEPGKLADLLFSEGDPTRNISDLARVPMVLKNGRLYQRDELLAPFLPGSASR
ncbi:amidohydrolase family protein [Amycolatopsis nigrescens]|uniref:amidohydrolase family protein n=1 Tax=Amycolatopsis nigrescens TaxID=381445 RepID=UPI0003732341|nr:amidohydrolase family protein [Amycolatopsis nigrescens]